MYGVYACMWAILQCAEPQKCRKNKDTFTNPAQIPGEEVNFEYHFFNNGNTVFKPSILKFFFKPSKNDLEYISTCVFIIGTNVNITNRIFKLKNHNF